MREALSGTSSRTWSALENPGGSLCMKTSNRKAAGATGNQETAAGHGEFGLREFLEVKSIFGYDE
jgi:hypothetical protein